MQEFYHWSVQYLDKWTTTFKVDFTKETLEWMSCSQPTESTDSLQTVPFQSVLECAQRFCPNVAVNEGLFDEVVEVNETLSQIMKRTTNFKELSIPKKWQIILLNNHLPLLTKLIDSIFSIPCSNAFCERVFSLLNVQWTDERNSLDFSTIAAILCVLVNADLKCCECVQFLHSENVYKMLKSTEKYMY